VVVGAQNVLVTSISGYVGAVDSAPHNEYELGIYRDNNGTPGTLIGRSVTGILRPNAWNTLNIRATLIANKAYWLVYNTNASTSSLNQLAYTTPSGSAEYTAGDEAELTIAQAPPNSASPQPPSYLTPGPRRCAAPPTRSSIPCTRCRARRQPRINRRRRPIRTMVCTA
jgi:hypothetical protein